MSDIKNFLRNTSKSTPRVPNLSEGPCPACGRNVCHKDCPLDQAGYGR